MNKFERMVKTLPRLYAVEVSTYLKGLLKAWAVSDDELVVQITEAKNQLFEQTAEGRYLDFNANNYGVERSASLGVEDDDFRELIPILSMHPKQVRSTIISMFEVFWGPSFTRANQNAGSAEPYNFSATTSLTGTLTFTEGQRTVLGIGTSFNSEVEPGEYIRPTSLDDTAYVRVSKVLSDTELELTFPYEGVTQAVTSSVLTSALELNYIADKGTERTIRIEPSYFEDLTEISAEELAEFINDSEHSDYIEGAIFLDPLSGNKLSIRTKTAGLQGAIQITGGTANASSILNFPLDVATQIKAAVFEINPNEIIVKIPSSVPVLRRSLRGSEHPKGQKTSIYSAEGPFDFSSLGSSSTLTLTVDDNSYTVMFDHANDFLNSAKASVREVVEVINSQLTYLKAYTNAIDAFKVIGLRTTEGSSEYQITGGTANTLLQFSTDAQVDPDIIQSGYPSSYLFNTNNQTYTVTGTHAKLIQSVGQGSTQTTIAVDDASNFPSSPGLLLFDFGRGEQEGPIRYNSRPNNSTLLIDASYIFQNNHLAGRYVNLISETPTVPRVTGEDFPFFITGTQEARSAAQDLIKKLIASGIIIRFEISFPEVLFECAITVSESSDYFGSRTGTLTPPFPTT